ncbi:hypothetical protein MKX03_000465, partial [Papaver bracteatum]
ILRNRNLVLEARVSQLVDCNAELQRKLHESQVANQHLEQQVNAQKEAEESKKYNTGLTKKNGRKGKAEYEYNTRKALKAGAAMPESTSFEDESLTVQLRNLLKYTRTRSASHALLEMLRLLDELIARLRGI